MGTEGGKTSSEKMPSAQQPKIAMALMQVAAVLVLRSGSPKMGVEEVKKWVSDKLPSYQAPREVR